MKKLAFKQTRLFQGTTGQIEQSSHGKSLAERGMVSYEH